MSEENAPGIVFRTSQYDEAVMLCEMLVEAGITADMLGENQSAPLGDGDDESLAIRIVVPALSEAKAVALIEAHMQSIGAKPDAETPPAEDSSPLACPNCAAVELYAQTTCSGCGYEILRASAPLVSVKEYVPGARSFCPECREPLTFPFGTCGACGEDLEPLESGDRLCPPLTHVLYRDTVGGCVCKACRRIWVDLTIRFSTPFCPRS